MLLSHRKVVSGASSSGGDGGGVVGTAVRIVEGESDKTLMNKPRDENDTRDGWIRANRGGNDELSVTTDDEDTYVVVKQYWPRGARTRAQDNG